LILAVLTNDTYRLHIIRHIQLYTLSNDLNLKRYDNVYGHNTRYII